MTQIKVDADGMVALSRYLDLFAKEVGPENAIRTLGPPLRTSMRPYVRELKSRTPVATGELRRSAKMRVGFYRATGAMWARVGWIGTRKDTQQQVLARLVVEGGRTAGRRFRRVRAQRGRGGGGRIFQDTAAAAAIRAERGIEGKFISWSSLPARRIVAGIARRMQREAPLRFSREWQEGVGKAMDRIARRVASGNLKVK